MSGWYTDGKESLLARSVPAEAGVFVVGVNDAYTFDAAHTDFTLITPCILLPELQLTGVTFTGGILRAENPSWPTAGAGIADRSLELRGLILYFEQGDAGTLLAFIDSATAGLPQTLTGINVDAVWDAAGILKL